MGLAHGMNACEPAQPSAVGLEPIPPAWPRPDEVSRLRINAGELEAGGGALHELLRVEKTVNTALSREANSSNLWPNMSLFSYIGAGLLRQGK